MIVVLFNVIQSLFGAFRSRLQLLLENLAFRHQLAVLRRNSIHYYNTIVSLLFQKHSLVLPRHKYGNPDSPD